MNEGEKESANTEWQDPLSEDQAAVAVRTVDESKRKIHTAST